MSARFPPYTEKNKKLLLSLLKNSSLTYDKIGKTILTIFILCILALVIGLVVIPKALEGWLFIIMNCFDIFDISYTFLVLKNFLSFKLPTVMI